MQQKLFKSSRESEDQYLETQIDRQSGKMKKSVECKERERNIAVHNIQKPEGEHRKDKLEIRHKK